MTIQERPVSTLPDSHPAGSANSARLWHLPRKIVYQAAILLTLLSTTLAGLSLTAMPGAAADQSPRAFLQGIYKHYIGKSTPGVVLDSDADIKRYFTSDMASIILADEAKAAQTGDIPTLDGDPFVGHQDWSISTFQIDVDNKAMDKTIAKVSFKNDGKMETVTLDLVKVDGTWKIDDIHWPEDSLRSIYRQ